MKNFYKEYKTDDQYILKRRDHKIKKQSELEISNRIRYIKAIYPSGRCKENGEYNDSDDNAFWKGVKFLRNYILEPEWKSFYQEDIFFEIKYKLEIMTTEQENPKDDLISYNMKICVPRERFDKLKETNKARNLTHFDNFLHERYLRMIYESEKEDKKFQPEFEKFLTKNGW